ncbi:nucleotide exchange factor GrpE [Gammaproteobacteria bacterium]|nr:nucleotide exchange factor GrpE [Gammaproteobacteria bacterium]
MANKPTDETTPEELDSDAIEESSDDQQSQSDGPEEAKGLNEAKEGQADAGDSSAQDDTSEELTKVKDQLLRTVAEMENVRRRAQRDVENAHKFAVEKLLSDLLPVVDSLEKAEEAAKTTDNADSMAEGISLSLKLFVSTLERSGIAIVDPLGELFDPQLHEAMAMVSNPDAEPNSVMDVMQRGYTLNGRLVRAAKVVVVKGE